jgi:hypothetical protein
VHPTELLTGTQVHLDLADHVVEPPVEPVGEEVLSRKATGFPGNVATSGKQAANKPFTAHPSTANVSVTGNQA